MAGRQSRVDGLSSAVAYLDSVPEAARDEMVVEMGILGREILAAQEGDVAKDTGATAGALTLQIMVEQLKMRVGLIKGSSSRGSRNNFVGRLIEGGRKAQTALVTRRIKKRKVKGNGRYGTKRRVLYGGATTRIRRRGPNKGTAIGSPYKMRVKAMAARPFIAQPEIRDAAELHLSEFWSRALTRLGGS